MNESLETNSSENNTKAQNDRPIFIVGMPRSGTTLMTSMLSAHPNIAISPESHFLWYWRKRYSHLNINDPNDFEIFWQDFSNSQDFKKFNIDSQATKTRILATDKISYKSIFTNILQKYAVKMQKSRWGEKTPAHYSYLYIIFKWYPEAKVIWMLRDPRSVTASLMRMSWTHSYTDRHAQKWCDSIRSQNKWIEDERVLLVKYEVLVTNPESQMGQICQFLGEEYCPNMIGDTSNNSTNSYVIRKAPNQNSLEKWRSILSPNQIAILEYIARNEMLEQGYQPITTKLTLGQSSELFLIKGLRRIKQNFMDKVANKLVKCDGNQPILK